MAAKKKSYVISVSLMTGCYRHIKISADATLRDLHEAIIDAYEFDDDHAHAFYMDNKFFSTDDEYICQELIDFDPFDSRERSTSDYTLRKLRFTKGTAFKYLFDFGDEWRFQCKVLRELDVDDVADEPVVVRSVGDAPPQYGDYDEDNEDCDEDFEEDESVVDITGRNLIFLYKKNSDNDPK